MKDLILFLGLGFLILMVFKKEPANYLMVERQALLTNSRGAWGSAIIVGGGYLITATHLIMNNDTVDKIIVFSPQGIDSNASIIKIDGDVCLMKTSLGVEFLTLDFEKPELWDKVYWIQFIHPNIPLICREGMVATKFNKSLGDKNDMWAVMEYIYPGVSGSAVWRNNTVIGMFSQFMEFDNIPNLRFGLFCEIPETIISEIK